MIDKVLAHIDKNRQSAVERLSEWLRIPSVSTDPKHAKDLTHAAQWVHDLFAGCGINSEIVQTQRHPCVIADTGPTDKDGPVILVYGHYDVQPAGDPALWKSPAFEPTVRDGAIFARGAADDKGQVFAHLVAAESWMKTAGATPIRVKFLIEGEEEIGSPNIAAVLNDHRERLACDYVVISDTPKFDDDKPAITYGTKGMIYKEMRVRGPKQNLHSGAFGGTVTNPGNALASIIASLHDAKNRVAIPDFYRDVRELTADECASMEALPFDESGYQESLGVSALTGEDGYSTLQRRWARPTLDVNGMHGGFTGAGASTIIPAEVMAKVSMRIVPDQDPEHISNAFDEAVRAAAPPGVTVEINTLATCAAYLSPLDSDGMRAASEAVAAGFGKKPLFIREGGSLPILPMFKSTLGAESLMIGFSVPNANIHGPNEFLGLDDLHHGSRTAALLLEKLAR